MTDTELDHDQNLIVIRSPTAVTFTGVDERTDIRACAELSKDYPIEWGFLLSETRQENRYSGINLIPKAHAMGLQISLHLCGRVARRTMESGVFPEVAHHCNRVQVNLRSHEYTWEGLSALAKVKTTIMQTRDTSEWPLTPLDVQPLLDCSGGRGVELAEWPKTVPAQLVGYAGGFRPDNVASYLRDFPDHPHGFWIDMESGVRTDDWLDLEKCKRVCEEVFK